MGAVFKKTLTLPKYLGVNDCAIELGQGGADIIIRGNTFTNIDILTDFATPRQHFNEQSSVIFFRVLTSDIGFL